MTISFNINIKTKNGVQFTASYYIHFLKIILIVLINVLLNCNKYV